MKLINVLHIEDEPDIREITEFALEDEGFEITQCASGNEALEKAADLKPDLILIDMMMPGIDGLATAAKLRELAHLKHTPVIFMTAKVLESEQNKYQETGAIGVICKPFDAMMLADTIRSLMEKPS